MVLSVSQNVRQALKYRGGWKGLFEHMYAVSERKRETEKGSKFPVSTPLRRSLLQILKNRLELRDDKLRLEKML